VIAFRGKEPDRFGNPTWEVFLVEPEQRDQPRQLPARREQPQTIDGDYRDLSDDGGPPW
jgi:hypothetical protein